MLSKTISKKGKYEVCNMKKVLVLSTSLRKNSNSEILAMEFAAGAKEAGNDVEFLSLSGRKIGFCVGCLACQKTEKCVIRDDAPEITEKIKAADVLAFATPVYYYEMCGQMKTLLDRCNPLFPSDYAFRDVYLLATAADADESAMDGAVKGMQGWIDCFEKARLAGVVRGTGITDAGEAASHTDLLAQVRALGKGV